MESTIAPQAKWYTDLVKACEEIMTKHGISTDSDLVQDMQELLLETARNQYIAGNRSGIRWVREQARSAQKRQEARGLRSWNQSESI